MKKNYITPSVVVYGVENDSYLLVESKFLLSTEDNEYQTDDFNAKEIDETFIIDGEAYGNLW